MDPEARSQTNEDPKRGEQLRLLRDCELPKDWRDEEGHGVSAMAMKAVLKAIDDYGSGRRCWPSVGSLANSANLGKRTATRALAGLLALGLVIAEPATRHGKYGAPTNSYVIVWAEVAVRCRTPLERRAAAENHRAPAANQSALGTDQSALAANQSAPGGAQSDLEATKKRTPSSPPEQTEHGCGQSWRAVREELLRAGMKAAAKAVCEAKQHRLTEAYVLSLLAYFREHAAREKWEVGTLYYAIVFASPDEPVAPLFPAFTRAALSPERVAARELRRERSRRASRIIKDGHAAGLPEEAIRAQLAAAGCAWDDCDFV